MNQMPLSLASEARSWWLVSCSVLTIVLHVFKLVQNVCSYTSVNIDK